MPNGNLRKLIDMQSCGNCSDNIDTIKDINIFAKPYIHQNKIIFIDLKSENGERSSIHDREISNEFSENIKR